MIKPRAIVKRRCIGKNSRRGARWRGAGGMDGVDMRYDGGYRAGVKPVKGHPGHCHKMPWRNNDQRPRTPFYTNLPPGNSSRRRAMFDLAAVQAAVREEGLDGW